ncbi:MAG: hypothetical protein AMXMBFR64_45580 [Myxococcales bacterium]
MASLTPHVMHLWAPFDLVEKGGEGEGAVKLGRIKGIASSETQDADGEVVDQAGIDWSFFKSHGRGAVTLEHPVGVFNLIGEGVDVRLIDLDGIPATELEADLILTDPIGQAVWEKGRALKKAGARTKLGFSVEGQWLEKKGNRITKSRVTSVAVSAAPKNPHTWWEPMAASLLAAFRGAADPRALWRAEGVGYPAQGQVVTGGLAALVPQSMQGFDPRLLEELTNDDLLVTRVLRQLPQLSWSQGQSLIADLRTRMDA